MAGNTLAIVAAFFALFELVLRWVARATIELGSTIHLHGNFYLANIKNTRDYMLFGWSSLSWLLIGAMIILLFLAYFVLAYRALPTLRGGLVLIVGSAACYVLLAVIFANMGELLLQGGVTDYLAFVDLEKGRARVINLGDVAVTVSAALISLSFLGVVIAAILHLVNSGNVPPAAGR